MGAALRFAGVAVWLIGSAVFAGTAAGESVAAEGGGAAEPTTAPAVYGENVRSTPWLEPAKERAGFHVPAGFEVRLFAAEPEIGKPLNLAFDERGRMWMTQSTAYPYPAEGGSSEDAVMILEDADGDGRAEKVTKFAGGLNIPIGVLPYGDGCLCFSIPNIWYLRDTDGDGRCDRREKVLGPFDTSRDTHGLINSLRDGGDGWIYACHGFNNRSEVAGDDGHVVRLHSGNTFRFRPDGSRVEQVTQGQVNPFGMTEDDWGYRYSADCHSKPITQLIPGACYPSFGRPHDGLGFLPPTVDHLHGSTAISGIAFVSRHSPIVPLRGQIISGNVMTSRINRNRIVYRGATARGEELTDFLTSDDPWFRPVDIRVGPDDHVYVADFYNRIIGHYEVPLDHPGRDRKSGRVWQIRYVGSGSDSTQHNARPQDAELPADQTTVAEELDALASEYPDDRIRRALESAPWRAAGPRRRIAMMRLATELAPDASGVLERVREALRSTDPHVARQAAETLGRIGDFSDVQRLLETLRPVPDSDPVLRQSLRIAIRDRVEAGGEQAEGWRRLSSLVREGPREDAENLASVLLAVASPQSSDTILDFLQRFPGADARDALIRHAAEHASAEALGRCVRIAKRISGADPLDQATLLEVVAGEGTAGGANRDDAVRGWAIELATDALDRVESAVAGTGPLVGWSASGGPVWPGQERPLASRDAAGEPDSAHLMSSHPLGETYQGVLRSDAFPAPQRLSFWVAGHNGYPDRPDHGKNRLRLRSADGGEVLREVGPPRNDTARRVRWNLSGLDGRPVRIECADRDDAAAYAWIAFGRFSPDWLHQARPLAMLELATRLVRQFEIDTLDSRLVKLAGDERLSPGLRLAVAGATRRVRSVPEDLLAVRAARKFPIATGAKLAVVDAVLGDAEPQTADSEWLETFSGYLTSAQQTEFARMWAAEGGDVDRLLELGEAGIISPAAITSGEASQTLRAGADDSQTRRLDQLAASLPAVDEQKRALVDKLARSVRLTAADATRGAGLYKKHCAACHQLRGEGSVVGPQLDGAVTRTTPRLLEDIVTPHRNVDKAFRTTSLLLDDGRVMVGVIQAEDDNVIRLANNEGKSIAVDAETILERKPSSRSLMPDNFGELLTADDFADLIAFIKSRQ